MHHDRKWSFRQKALFGIKSVTAEGRVDAFTRKTASAVTSLCVHRQQRLLSVCVCKGGGRGRGKNLVEVPKDTVNGRR